MVPITSSVAVYTKALAHNLNGNINEHFSVANNDRDVIMNWIAVAQW